MAISKPTDLAVPQYAVRGGTAGAGPTRAGSARDWQRWAPYAAVAWSMAYALLGAYWVVSGHGFPYAPDLAQHAGGPLAGQFGPGVAWIIVVAAGLPAATVGVGMLRGPRALRPILLTAGVLLAGALLLLMIDLNLLILVGYVPYGLVRLLSGAEFGQSYLAAWAQWSVAHQWLCLMGGFLWLAATVSYARRSGAACLYCGRRAGPEGWTSPDRAARWGRLAVYAAMVVPMVYALTRYAWALGIPLGMSAESLRQGQASGLWTSGLFLATFGLVGALLTLGLAQPWGEVFPWWMLGLAGRRVPIALAVVPAAIVSVLLMVGGLAMWSGYTQMAGAAQATGQDYWIVVGPVVLFPVWAVALAVAALGYYYRQRGPCAQCGRGQPAQAEASRQPQLS